MNESEELSQMLDHLRSKQGNKIMVQVRDLRGTEEEEAPTEPPEDPKDVFNRRMELAKQQVLEDTQRQMSPPGALHLPKELEEARWKHGLIDSVFRIPLFERIYVWQFEESDVDLQGSALAVPDITRQRLAKENPRGLLVGAGAGAMDILRSHGLKLGYTVTFLKNSMWRIKVGEVCRIAQHLVPLVIGDILDCDELSALFREGKLRYEFEKGSSRHRLFEAETKEYYDPLTPHIGDDYAH